MPRKKQVDADKLIAAVKAGKPSKEIMEEFGIKTTAHLKALYYDALVEKGLAPAIADRGSQAAAEKKTKQIQVNKRGSLIVPAPMVEEFGFKEGELFTVRKTKAGVSLKRA
ncbi:MAG: hypothetical protein KKB20_15420 [Proteobacteria bacterium]|nr:hypothetical protein [Pseudomonadota bacterium]